MAGISEAADQKIMTMVEAELGKNPDVSNDVLMAKAKKISRGVSSLSNRQFHARYPLQIKRRHKRAAGGGTRRKTSKVKATRASSATRTRAPRRRSAVSASVAAGGSVDREAVRNAFLGFASDLAAAEARKDVVKVLAGVDKYVDQAIRAASS